MSLTNLYFLVFTVIDLWLLYHLVARCQTQMRLWRRESGPRPLLLVAAWVVLGLMAVALAFMLATTADSWWVSLDPSLPKPFFLTSWLVGGIPYALLSMAVTALHTRVANGQTSRSV